MNYWPAEVCNLGETVIPLTSFLEELTVPGGVTAREMCGAKGWTLHHTTDPFGKTAVLDGNRSYDHLRLLLEKSTLPNLFDTHPPFQIDGNFGGTAGIAEMLLQSHNGVIRILPALPDAWPGGKVAGLKARGNFEVSIEWHDGGATFISVRSLSGVPLNIAYRESNISMDTQKCETHHFDSDLKWIR